MPTHTHRIALVLLLALAGCVPDGLTDFDFHQLVPPPPAPEATASFEPVGEGTAGVFRVVVYAEGGARAGRRPLRIGVADANGAVVANAAVMLSVEVARGLGWTTVPSGVAGPTNADGYAAAEALLIPERDGAAALLRVTVSGAETVVQTAVADDARRLARSTDAEGRTLYAVWIDPVRPLVGENVWEAALFVDAGSTVVPLVGSAVQLYPYMDMGGGEGHSTPFDPPFEPAPGRIRSAVNFIMSGGWDLTLYVRRPGVAARDTLLFSGFSVYDQ